MKNRKLFMILFAALALMGAFMMGAAAAGTAQEISAYLDPSITVKYEGSVQTLTDAAGNPVYPITYNGTTYLPVRAVSDMLGVGVEWDAASRSVILGQSPNGTDLIESFKPYTDYTTEINPGHTSAPEFLQSGDKKTQSIGGETANRWIGLRTTFNTEYMDCSFNLGGKFASLTFKVYAEQDAKLTVKGDNGGVLGEFDLKGGQVPQTVTVDLLNTTQLTFDCDKATSYPGGRTWYTYIYEAVLS